MPTKSTKATERCNLSWLEGREAIKDAVLSSFAQVADFRLGQPRSLSLPVNPVTCTYYDGVNSLFLMKAAYDHYQETKIFDARFAFFKDYAAHELRLRKGCHGHNFFFVDGFDKQETIDDDGVVVSSYYRAKVRKRSYAKVFHTHHLVNPPVPISTALSDEITLPFADQQVFDSFIAGWLEGIQATVQFVDKPQQVMWAYDPKLLTISLPHHFDTMDAFIDSLVVNLLNLSFPAKPNDSLSILVCTTIAHLFLMNALLMPYRLSSQHSEVIDTIESMDNGNLFFHALAAEQLCRRVLKTSGMLPLVLQAQMQSANHIMHDFFLFSKSEKQGATASKEATLQHSEPQVISFDLG